MTMLIAITTGAEAPMIEVSLAKRSSSGRPKVKEPESSATQKMGDL
jgi:hypothetical protein